MLVFSKVLRCSNWCVLECFGHTGPGERNDLQKVDRDRLVASDCSRRWSIKAGTDGACRCSAVEDLTGNWEDFKPFYWEVAGIQAQLIPLAMCFFLFLSLLEAGWLEEGDTRKRTPENPCRKAAQESQHSEGLFFPGILFSLLGSRSRAVTRVLCPAALERRVAEPGWVVLQHLQRQEGCKQWESFGSCRHVERTLLSHVAGKIK